MLRRSFSQKAELTPVIGFEGMVYIERLLNCR